MFEALYELARHGPLSLAISAGEWDQRMTVVVLPKPKEGADEPALAAPLVLCGSPAEFDAEFVTLLTSYRAQRQTLAEQAEQTKELLAAATEASAKKGSAAVAKAGKGVKPSAKAITPIEPNPAVDDGDETVGDEGEGAGQMNAESEGDNAARQNASGSAFTPTAATPNLFS